jgi:hypothetical protein
MGIVTIMYRILCFLEKCDHVEKFDESCFKAEFFRATETEFVRAIEELLRMNCVDGISVKRSADDSLFSISIPAPRITYDGIKFLHTDALMLEADRAVKSQG